MSYTPPSGNDVRLIFFGAYSAPAGNAVDLDFTTTLPNGLSISAALDDVTGLIALSQANPLMLAAFLDDVAGLVQLDWTASVFRGLTAAVRGRHAENQNPAHRQSAQPFQEGLRTPARHEPSWQSATPIRALRSGHWRIVAAKRQAFKAFWDSASNQHHGRGGRYRASPHQHKNRSGGWRIAEGFALARGSLYRSPPAQDQALTVPLAAAGPRLFDWVSEFAVGTVVNRRWFAALWEVADPHSWLWGGWRYPPPGPGPVYNPSTQLVFYQKSQDFTGGAILEFNRPCWAWPLIRKNLTLLAGVTIMIHAIEILRLPDLVTIPVLSASLQFDIDSWAWRVTLQLQTQATMALLAPIDGEPRQVRIEIDGYFVTALIESWSENRQLGETTYTASGRSILALFAPPYAPIRSYLEASQKTAAQLIDHELQDTGWSTAYHPDLAQLFTTDWLVPGGAWSYQNKAPVDAIAQIAAAVGARAYADRSAAIVHIAPRYPVSPWDWAAATPDVTVPLGLVRSIATQLTPQPGYNQVYVSGQNQGVLVSAIRTGSAGDKPAPMITEPLITFVNAGRERARTILANTGRQARVTLDLPLNASTGLLEPGQLVEVADTVAWRGLVTGVQVAAAHGSIGQQVEIERHYP